jgi:hypothetical protein
MNVAIFWDRVPCSQYANRNFGATYHLHLVFEPEYDTFLRNAGSHTVYTTLFPTRWQHSKDVIILSVL